MIDIKKINKWQRFVILIIIDIFSFTISFFLAFLIRFDFGFPTEYISVFSIWLPISIILKLSILLLFRTYNKVYRYSSINDLVRLILLSWVATLSLVLLSYLTIQFKGFPRSIFLIDLLLTISLLSFSRLFIRVYIASYLNKKGESNHLKRILLIGAGDASERIIREIIRSKPQTYKIIGIMDDNPVRVGSTIHGIKINGSIDKTNQVTTPYDEILIAIPSADTNEFKRIIKICRTVKKPIKTIPPVNQIFIDQPLIKSMRKFSYLDLIGREEIKLDEKSISKYISDKVILITGGGGSIGSELARQVIQYSPKRVIMLDNSEYNCFTIEQEFSEYSSKNFDIVLGDIRDKLSINNLFKKYKPNIVFHSAAYKHVPILSQNPYEAINTNIFGTLNVINTSIKYNIDKFILVSTDKAVNPINIMGMTKRINELMILAAAKNSDKVFNAVRFGNVMGSSGSVLPIFEKQINKRQPITLTHPDMKRYFMSIPEAAQLIIQAGSFDYTGKIFVLKMGEQVKIIDIAKDLISFHGLRPYIDIPINITGIRKGEKLEEEIYSNSEFDETKHDKILILKSSSEEIDWTSITNKINDEFLISPSHGYDLFHKKLKEFLEKVDAY